MKFRKHKPIERLLDVVDCFWSLKSEGIADIYSARTYPDGCTNAIFNFGDPIYLRLNGRPLVQKRNTISIYGNVTRFTDFRVGGNVDIFSINFRPGGLSSLTNIPLFELTNDLIDAEDIIPSFNHDLLEQLSQVPPDRRAGQVSEAMTGGMTSIACDDGLLMHCVTRISGAYGNLSVDAIANEIGLSIRQLERRFRNRVGLSPKKLCRILRFRHVQEILKSPAAGSILHIAYDQGYFDHAHLTKDFESLAGVSPSYFSQYLPYF